MIEFLIAAYIGGVVLHAVFAVAECGDRVTVGPLLAKVLFVLAWPLALPFGFLFLTILGSFAVFYWSLWLAERIGLKVTLNGARFTTQQLDALAIDCEAGQAAEPTK